MKDLNRLAEHTRSLAESRGYLQTDNELCWVMDIISESMEAADAVIFNKVSDYESFYEAILSGESYVEAYEKHIKDGFAAELVSIIIATLSVASKAGIDIEESIKWELKYSKLRR